MNSSLPEDVVARIAALEAENARLNTIANAAKEALAVFEGRRPGFAPAYAREILRTVFADDPVALGRSPRQRKQPARKPRTPRKPRPT